MKTIAAAAFFLALSASAHAAQDKAAQANADLGAKAPVVLTAIQLDRVTAGYSTLFSGGVFVASSDVSGSTTTVSDGSNNAIGIGELLPSSDR